MPMDAGYNNGYYKKIMELIQPMFSKAFKGNDSLKLGVLTGVLRISGESLFSSFNNPKIYDIMSEGYNDFFGFTEEETKELLEYYGLKLTKEVKDYYDGYNFNDVHIYNPWSIINYAEDKVLMPYWINTGSNTLIKDLLKDISEENKIKIERLLLGESISFEYEPKMSYGSLAKSNNFNSVLNLMLLSGYLTYSYTEDGYTYFRIPNNEVKQDISKMIESIMFYENIKHSNDGKEFINSIIENAKVKAEEHLNRILSNVSYFDSKESFYHGYVLSLFNTFLSNIDYLVYSNSESGYGRPDMIIKKKDKSVGLVFEFKQSKTAKDMEQIAKEGLKQLKTKNYKESLEREKIKVVHEYVIVFYGKRAIIR